MRVTDRCWVRRCCLVRSRGCGLAVFFTQGRTGTKSCFKLPWMSALYCNDVARDLAFVPFSMIARWNRNLRVGVCGSKDSGKIRVALGWRCVDTESLAAVKLIRVITRSTTKFGLSQLLLTMCISNLAPWLGFPCSAEWGIKHCRNDSVFSGAFPATIKCGGD